MKTTLAISTAALMIIAAPVLAQGKSDAAKGMAGAIQEAGNGSVPASDIKGGWGNAVGPATSTNGAAAVGPKPSSDD